MSQIPKKNYGEQPKNSASPAVNTPDPLLAKRLATLEGLKDTLCQPGNYDQSEYTRGLANGLILAVATLKGEEPKYLDVAPPKSQPDPNAAPDSPGTPTAPDPDPEAPDAPDAPDAPEPPKPQEDF